MADLSDSGVGEVSTPISTVLLDEWKLLFRVPGEAAQDVLSSPDAPPTSDPTPDDWTKTVDGLQGTDTPTALCLSGGGIRSATFSLGVVQGLARNDQLKTFHYLSTVSGGGYLGAWLTGWIARAGIDEVDKELRNIESPDTVQAGAPRAPTLDAPEEPRSADARPVARLRAYSNYLSPVWGLSVDAFTLAATFIRNLFLHGLAVVPLIVGAVLLARLYVSWLGSTPDEAVVNGLFAAAIESLILCVVYVASDLPGKPSGQGGEPPNNWFGLYCMAPLAASALILSLIVVWLRRPGSAYGDSLAAVCLAVRDWADVLKLVLAGIVIHLLAAVLGWAVRPARGLAPRRYTYPVRAALAAVVTGAIGGLALSGLLAVANSIEFNALLKWSGAYAALSVPALLLVFWTAATFHVGLARRFTSEDDREWWSRASAVSLALSLAWAAFLGLVAVLPVAVLSLPWLNKQKDAAETVGLGTALLGALSSAWGFWSKRGAGLAKSAEALTTKLGLRTLDLAALTFIVLFLVSLSLGLSALARAHVPVRPDAKAMVQNLELIKEKSAASIRATCPDPKPASTCPGVTVAGGEESSPVAGLFRVTLWGTESTWLFVFLLVLVAWAIGVNVVTGVNAFSLHSMYANRLIRAYLGASRGKDRKPHWFTGFDPEDNPAMEKVAPAGRRLFHVINIALNLSVAAGGRLEWQQRKAASFFVTPRFCGSANLGFVETRRYGKTVSSSTDDHARTLSFRKRLPNWVPELASPAEALVGSGITLGRAMAISGAAASPNMGYQTSSVVALVMSLFNVRLGWWLPNPKASFSKWWSHEEPPAGTLTTTWQEATGRTSDNRPFVYLSDGGHFENLGLYEMIRRRCRRIVLVDATHDPDYSYQDLENCVRKCRVDFGAEITFPNGLPTAESVVRTGAHFAVGTVELRRTMPDGSSAETVVGRIIYVKPALSGDEPIDVARYASATRRRAGSAFPHDPTWRQDFDEAQFESYRKLGLHSVSELFKGGRSPWEEATPPPEHKRPGPVVAPGAPAPPAERGESATAVVVGTGAALSSLIMTGVLTASVAVTATVVLTKGDEPAPSGKFSLEDNRLRFDDETKGLLSDVLRNAGQVSTAVAALRDSIGPVAIAAPSSPSTSATPGSGARSLVDAVNVLSARIPAAGAAPGDITVIQAEVRQIQTAINLIYQEMKGGGPRAKELEQLTRAVATLAESTNQLRLAVERRGAASGAAITSADLKSIVTALGEIKSAIVNSSPRRNVSGSTEGGRP